MKNTPTELILWILDNDVFKFPPLATNLNTFGVIYKMPFRLVSYNVLADTFAREEIYPYATFEGRHDKVIARVLSMDADIVCLQEVSAALSARLHRALKDKYTISYSAYRMGMMGLATLVRKSSGFTVERELAVVVCCMTADDQDTFGSHLDNICLLVNVRRAKSASPSFIRIANTHAPCIPGNPKISNAFVEKLLRVTGTRNNLIVAGDFNMLPDSPGYLRMTESLTPCTDPSRETTCSSCRKKDKDVCFSGAIDFIFASKQLEAAIEPTVEIAGLLPSSTEPSDHVPVSCTFC